MSITDQNFSESGATVPAAFAVAITPSDALDLDTRSRGIYIGTNGDLAVRMAGNPGTTVTFQNVVAGSVLPLRVTRIMTTGTTAGGLIAIF